MKNQEYQGLYALRLFRLVPILLAALLACGICAGANSLQPFINENYNLIEQSSSLLGEEINTYTDLDGSPSKGVSKSVVGVINRYRKDLLDLQQHPDVGSRSLEREIALAYSKTVAAGRLAWIYYYNISQIDSEPVRADLLDTYTALTSQIDSADSASLTDALADKLCNEMNRAAYRQHLSLLAQTGDSVFCASIIAGAIEECEHVTSHDSFGTGYKTIYDSAAHELSLQRARDSLEGQIRYIFSLVSPDGNFDTDSRVGLFVYRLKNAATVSEANEAARAAVTELTSVDSSRAYAHLHASQIGAAVAQEVLVADGAGRGADLLPLFSQYVLDRLKADTKDRIVTILASVADDKEAERIEQSFNADGKIIDLCQSEASLSIELERAQSLAELYSSTLSSLEQLSVILGPHSTEALSKRINERYLTASNELYTLSAESQSFVENCNNALSRAARAFEDVLLEARAERFLSDNRDIIKKPLSDLSVSDEHPLRSALNSYISLSENVKNILGSQINSIVEKYKSVILIKMRSMSINDDLYLELCELLCAELSSLSSNDIAVFYNNCDLVLSKCTVLHTIVDYYRVICASADHPNYGKIDVTALSDAVRNAAKELDSTPLSADKAFDAQLELVLKNTIVSIDRISQFARVRVCTRGSNSPSVEKLLENARSVIYASSDRADMIALADASIFRIERLLTVETVIARAEEAAHIINEMTFLSSEEKPLLIQRIEALKKSAADSAAVAQSKTVLSFVWNNFTADLSSISGEAVKKDRDIAVERYTDLIDKELTRLDTELTALANLTAERKSEISAAFSSVIGAYKTALGAYSDSTAVADGYADTLTRLEELRRIALGEDLSIYRDVISAELEKLAGSSAVYSESSIAQIRAIIDSCRSRLPACTDIRSCSALLEEARTRISSVNDLLDDAKREATDTLSEAIAACRALSALYSDNNLATAEHLYTQAIAELERYTSVSDTDALKAHIARYISAIRAVRMDLIYTPGATVEIEHADAAYPAGYDISGGYYGRIYSQGGIISTSRLSIIPPTDSPDLDQIQRAVRKAAKRGELTAPFDINASTLRLLRTCTVPLCLDVSLSSISPDTSAYTLQILLPDSLADENILGLAYINGDSVEFYPCARRDMLLSAELTHLSRYYIVTERVVDLSPLLIFLLILLVFELVALCFIMFLRFKRMRKETPMLPDSYLRSVAPAPLMPFALQIKPEGGVGLALLLTVAALALGCGIAFFARAELTQVQKRSRRPDSRPVSAPQEKEEDLALPTPRKAPLLHARTYLLGESERSTSACAVICDEAPTNTDRELCCEQHTPTEYNESPSECEGDPHTRDIQMRETASGTVRAQVNLDVIARKFRDGELVDLEALKRKRLVPKRTEHVKILARGTLTKPLVVEAHDFSRSAEDMLRAAGGEAIRIS